MIDLNVDDGVMRRLIGIHTMLIAAGAELNSITDVIAFTHLAGQTNTWTKDLRRMIQELDTEILARAENRARIERDLNYGRGYQKAVQILANREI